MESRCVVRKAVIGDSEAIKDIVNWHAERGMMLSRSVADVQQDIRSFHVAEAGGKVVGCCGLRIYYPDVAEIRSLAVRKQNKRRGIGTMLTQACLEEAKNLGAKSVLTLTYVPEFFIKLKFKPVDKNKLHPKIWGDCISCHKFPDCDENALIRKI